MNNYEYLQTIVNRFPSLMGLDCEVFPDRVKVIITDQLGNNIISKEMVVEGVFEQEEQVEDIKNQCAFDLVCHLCLQSHGTIKANIVRSQDSVKPQLN